MLKKLKTNPFISNFSADSPKTPRKPAHRPHKRAAQSLQSSRVEREARKRAKKVPNEQTTLVSHKRALVILKPEHNQQRRNEPE
jgi:hypothetical protein